MFVDTSAKKLDTASGYMRFSLKSLQSERISFERVLRSLLRLQVQKMCEVRLQRRHVTHCKLPTTCLATPLQHKSQRKLHRVTLAVELSSTFCNACRDF